MSIYETLCQERDRVKERYSSDSFNRNVRMNILSELMTIAFRNSDKLPHILIIENCHMSEIELEMYINRLGIIKIQRIICIRSEYLKGKTYQIETED